MIQLRDLLIRHGYNEPAASIHAAFLQSALQLLAEAHQSLTSAADWKAFKTYEGSMGSVKTKGTHRGHRLPNEMAISQELWSRMREIYHSDPESWPNLLQYQVQIDHDPPVMTGRRRGKKAKRSDLEIGSRRPDSPGVVIEAKVLEDEGHVVTRLLGKDGIGCFLRQEAYALNGGFGGLAAYVVATDPPDWRTAIASAYAAYPERDGDLDTIVVPPGIHVQIAPVKRTLINRPNILMLNLVMLFDRQAAT